MIPSSGFRVCSSLLTSSHLQLWCLLHRSRWGRSPDRLDSRSTHSWIFELLQKAGHLQTASTSPSHPTVSLPSERASCTDRMSHCLILKLGEKTKNHNKLTWKSQKLVLTHCTEVNHSLSGSALACNCSPLWTVSSEWNSFPVLCSSRSCWCDPWFPSGD